MKKHIIFLILGISLLNYSCETKTEFTVKNNSSSIIDSIKISNGYDFLFTKELYKGQVVNYILDFTELTPNFDGSFLIETYPKKRFKIFGYYSNGLQPNTHFFIEIKNDTILIKNRSRS